MDITGAPKLLVKICRNMGICCGFRVMAARVKYLGFVLLRRFYVPLYVKNGEIDNFMCFWDVNALKDYCKGT